MVQRTSLKQLNGTTCNAIREQGTMNEEYSWSNDVSTTLWYSHNFLTFSVGRQSLALYPLHSCTRHRNNYKICAYDPNPASGSAS